MRKKLVRLPVACLCCFQFTVIIFQLYSCSYVGHGAGSRFLDSQMILKQQMRAASLLFGCSSAALAVRGNQEGQGIILSYLIAGW